MQQIEVLKENPRLGNSATLLVIGAACLILVVVVCLTVGL